ncbi:MAG TPA: hypothetical protein VGW78_02975 [Candidatus Babeliales bacterium]|jgi:hypothetical protein|nr:hypothetical protein [Candidatus Babeliales bacterium]
MKYMMYVISFSFFLNLYSDTNNSNRYYCDTDCLDEYGDDWEFYVIQYIKCIRSKKEHSIPNLPKPVELPLTANVSNQKPPLIPMELPNIIEKDIKVSNTQEKKEKKNKAVHKDKLPANIRKKEPIDYYLSTGMSDDDVAAIRNNKW